jgi:hypothetical protein
MPSSDDSYPEFKPPSDLDGVLDGESGEALVKWKRKPSGNVCITSMEGVSLGSSDSDDDEDDLDYGPSPMARSQAGIDSLATAM